MEEKVLSVRDWNAVEEDLQRFQTTVTIYCDELKQAINVFNNNKIVQSFYESGNFGQGVQEELIKIKTSIEKYYESLVSSNGLIPITKTIVQSQQELLQKEFN